MTERRVPTAARGVLVLFAISAILLIQAAMCLFTDIGIGGPIIGWILGGAGLILLVIAIAAYVGLARWNAQRRAGWKLLDVHVLLDHARGEKDKTLIDTRDGRWRIALLNYPLELRDRIEREGQIEYIGELGHKKPVMVRPVGSPVEILGYARSMATLRERR